MDFSLSDEQQIIRETANKLLQRECSTALLHRAWEEPAAADSLWRDHLREWVGLAEQPLTDSILFVEEYGRALTPGVFLPTLIAALLARSVGCQLDGSASIAVSGADGLWIPGEGGDKYQVPCAALVDQILLVERSGGQLRLCIAEAAEFACHPMPSMDELRPLYRVTSKSSAGHITLSLDQWQAFYREALVLFAAELVGVGRRLLDAAISYAGEREQFGRPIGTFQGLQWKLVDATAELERAAATVAYAAMCLDAQDADAARASHCAKIEAGAAARLCARVSTQVHGGIGYTWEYGLHYGLRRAYAGDACMGPADFHAQQLADLLFAA